MMSMTSIPPTLAHRAAGASGRLPPMAAVAFIGLGVMGGPMARHLAGAGHDVTVFNRTKEKAAAWVAANGGASAPTPARAAEGADAVFVCVGNDDDVRS